MLLLAKIERKNKKALSNLVAYVLLISITISLSVLVYGWLKFYVEGDDVIACPSNVNVIINNYNCSSGVDGSLTVTLKNKGLFNIDGFVLRVHDRPDAKFGFYVFDSVGVPLSPGESFVGVYDFSNSTINTNDITDITFMDVQPFLVQDGDNVACESYASQRIVCD